MVGPEGECGGRAPQDVRPGEEDVAGQGSGQELPAGEGEHAGLRQPSSSRARAPSPAVYRPTAAPSRLPAPDSAATIRLACGNAPSRDWFDGRPKNEAFSAVSGMSVVKPSTETTRSRSRTTSRHHLPPAGPQPAGTRCAAAAGPSLTRPRDIKERPLSAGG